MRLGILAVRQTVHHFGESPPVNSLGALPSRARPEQGVAADLNLAELYLSAINLQRKRRLRLCERGVGYLRLHLIRSRQRFDPAFRFLRWHIPPPFHFEFSPAGRQASRPIVTPPSARCSGRGRC